MSAAIDTFPPRPSVVVTVLILAPPLISNFGVVIKMVPASPNLLVVARGFSELDNPEPLKIPVGRAPKRLPAADSGDQTQRAERAYPLEGAGPPNCGEH